MMFFHFRSTLQFMYLLLNKLNSIAFYFLLLETMLKNSLCVPKKKKKDSLCKSSYTWMKLSL